MAISKIDLMADKSIKWIGSTWSLAIHTLVFILVFGAALLGFGWDKILLVLTTAVSLEAIYLAIFIQMSVNRTTQSLHEVRANIGEIQEDVGEIQENVDEIQEDVGEIQEDVGEIQEEDESEKLEKEEQEKTMEDIQGELARLMQSVEKLSSLQHSSTNGAANGASKDASNH
jgi:uncharacterized protein YoxC